MVPYPPQQYFSVAYANASIEWAEQAHFDSFVASENFQIFKDKVLPHSHALPVPQLYNTDVQPAIVFRKALTEVWQVKIGEGNERAEECKVAWNKFVSAVAEAGGVLGDEQKFHGPSLNLEERRWVGALGWESSEVSLIRLKISWSTRTIWLTPIRSEKKYSAAQP